MQDIDIKERNSMKSIYSNHEKAVMGALKAGIASYFWYYNSMRLHQVLDYAVPDNMYQSFRSEKPDRNMAA